MGVEFGIANKVGSRRILVNIGFLVYLMMTLFGRDFLLCWLTHIARNGGHHSAVIADTKGNALGPRKKIDQSVRERLSPYFYFI